MSRAQRGVQCVAAAGVVFLCWETWTLIAWLTDDPGPITAYRNTGATSLVLARALEAVAVLVAIWVLAVIGRGIARERRLTLDAMFAIAGLTSFWLDPFYNFFRPNLLYSSQWINVGTWCAHVPLLPDKACGHVPEPVIFVGIWYVVGVPAAAMVGCGILRWVERTFPRIRWTRWKLALVALSFGFVLDMVWEIPILVADLWKYASFPAVMSLPGLPTSDRYPASPAVAGAIIFGGATIIRYFRNDRGETFIEAGVAHIRGRRRRAWLTQLASIGAIQLLALACITPILVPWPYHEHWPAYPSNILNGLCDRPQPRSELVRLCPIRGSSRDPATLHGR